MLVTTLANPAELASTIEGTGFQVRTAGSGEEALAAIRAHVPECILVDTSVVEPAAFVSATRELTDAYVLALDTREDPALTATLLAAGADAFLRAPYPDALLHASLLVARRHAARQRSPIQMDSRRYGDLLINFSQGRVRKGEEAVAERFLERQAEILEPVFAGFAGQPAFEGCGRVHVDDEG